MTENTPDGGSPLVPRLELLAAAVLFSTGGAAIKATSFTAWQVACFRSGIAAAALLLFLPGGRRWREPKALAAGTAYALTLILFVTANKLTTAANTIFLQSTAPLYLLLLAPWLLREPVRRVELALAAVLAAGLVLFFVGYEPALATAPDPRRGNMLAAVAGLSWALTLLGLRWLGRQDGARGVTAGSAVVAGNLLACLTTLPWAWPIAGARAADWMVVAYLGLFQIGLAYFLVTRALRRLAALEASLLLLVEPVLNAVWAWLVHGERPGSWSLAGCAIILAASCAFALVRRS